ncbi:gamma-glutamyl-gamma-aminobutyrate hydrolase [Burkholderia ubonensis]|uniref:gamma-glutamyl-gamma-aminobutyrate hydrolase family protein n=1 Tax=Burkholderia ubonensis TaxID=101571 RepID=UPI0007560582|nr:gamma-glutamyl-gamma-aminobutyrate hydrolase family protein [Burkholderia ubonensis]KVR12659.1 gamma-glutamyl-gamma-aminobutyrate hydrolase [Burkholderia ubonensis]
MPFDTAPPSALPIVGIIADSVEYCGHRGHSVLHGYVHAVAKVARALPVLLPSCAEALDSETLNATLDGIVLTGSSSNVAAERYGASPLSVTTKQDHWRDSVVFNIFPSLIAAGIPTLGICRGLQELNVMYGGTLEAAVHTRPDRLDHREGDRDRPIERWYDDRHAIRIMPGGVLGRLTTNSVEQVNSLHHQGIDRLGDGLRIEAVATDGLIEAFSICSAPQFTLAVQWHPEMRIGDSPLSRAIFESFGAACRLRRNERIQLARV